MTTQQFNQSREGARGAQRLMAGAVTLAATLAALSLPAAGASAAAAPDASRAARPAATVTSGTIRAWGLDNDGQVGDGTETNGDAIPVPVKLATGTKVTQVRAGGFFTLALTTAGKVLAWGDNTYGQLGNRTTGGLSTKPVTVQFPTGTTIKAIRAGFRHGLALTTDGKVYAWGYNALGQLGNGTSGPGTDSNHPVLVHHLPPVKSISAGMYFNLALTTSGKVYGWGGDQFGQLGDGNVVPDGVATPVQATLPVGTTVTGLAATFGDSVILTSKGQVLVAGDNTFGELGSDSTADHSATPAFATLPTGTTVKGVFGGNFHILALTGTGKVLAWGLNNHGQLGNGDLAVTDSFHPIRVKLPTGTTAKAIAAGAYHSLALLTNGKVYAWGFDNDGELGNGMFTDSPTPVPVKLASTLVVTGISAGPGADTSDAIVHQKTS